MIQKGKNTWTLQLGSLYVPLDMDNTGYNEALKESDR